VSDLEFKENGTRATDILKSIIPDGKVALIAADGGALWSAMALASGSTGGERAC
jgi:hypothetical protein